MLSCCPAQSSYHYFNKGSAHDYSLKKQVARFPRDQKFILRALRRRISGPSDSQFRDSACFLLERPTGTNFPQLVYVSLQQPFLQVSNIALNLPSLASRYPAQLFYAIPPSIYQSCNLYCSIACVFVTKDNEKEKRFDVMCH